MSRSYNQSPKSREALKNRLTRIQENRRERKFIKTLLDSGEEPDLFFTPTPSGGKKEKVVPAKRDWHDDRRRSILEEENLYNQE